MVEVLIALALLSLALTILISVLMPAMRTSARASDRMNHQQQGTLTMRRLTVDIQKTALEGLSYHPTLTLLTIHPITDVASDGSRTWGDSVRLYRLDNGQLIQSQSVPAVSNLLSHPFQPNLAQATPLLTNQSMEKTILRQVTEFNVTDADAASPAWEQPLTLSFKQEWEATGYDQTQSMIFSRMLFLRNP